MTFNNNSKPNETSKYKLKSGVAQWGVLLALNRSIVSSSPIKGFRCFLEQELYPPCLVLVGFMRNNIACFTVELK